MSSASLDRIDGFSFHKPSPLGWGVGLVLVN
jgi:hypothetical protein